MCWAFEGRKGREGEGRGKEGFGVGIDIDIFIYLQVNELGLEDRLLTTSKTSPAAQNRFIYYPDHIVRMPGPGLSFLANARNILSEPIFKGTISGALSELMARQRPPDVQDESVGSFISRRFGSRLADNVVSAIFHGIYAGDIYKLSARSILPQLWHIESEKRSITYAMLDRRRLMSLADADLLRERKYQGGPVSEARIAAAESSVFTFRGGIGELASRLEERLVESDNVHIQRETLVDDIAMIGREKNTKVELVTQSVAAGKKDAKALWEFSHVISTIAGSKLASIVSEKTPILSLFQTKAVTVMVVNLFYSNPSIVPVKGFGYLLPRSLPLDQNPERALGVVFDSDASSGQDAIGGTKLTVMLGGHWWDDYDKYPDEDEGAAMAKAILKRHLNITAEPEAVRVGLQKSCIPQYEVGHEQRMEQASKDLEAFEGRLRVAGSSYTGVGLNDCVRAAKDCVTGLVQGTSETGLEGFVGGRKWAWVGPEV